MADGVETTDRDDEMAEAARLFRTGRAQESKLYFRFSQADAIRRGVLVASYHWRKPYLDALTAFADANDCELVSVRQLLEAGDLEVGYGHGSPKSHFKGRGTVPYVKVSDIKNWRVIENPKYYIPEATAAKLRKDRPLRPYDLITPTRTTKNIGLFAVVMPWQTQVVLTREIAVWRVSPKSERLSIWLLLALMSLKVVNEQFRYLVLMQMNREDLGERYQEVLLPIPRSADVRARWSKPIGDYFTAQTAARDSYSVLASHLDPELFADRP